MMESRKVPIKATSRSARVAFSPDVPYLATGTMEGVVGQSSNSSASLEIFKLDFASDDCELNVSGNPARTKRFSWLSWGNSIAGSEEYSCGLIAGAMVDGNIVIWNPNVLINGRTGSSIVQKIKRHGRPVCGLDFNAEKHHMLAGVDNGDICVWDVAISGVTPDNAVSLKVDGLGAHGEISYLSWNKLEPNLLASCSNNGTTVIWDIRSKRAALSFAESVKRPYSVLQWRPDMPSQLIVASDKDYLPNSFGMYDFRNLTKVIYEFGPTEGVIAMSWSPYDSSYLLSSTRDNRTICWNVMNNDLVMDIYAETTYHADVQWCPKNPGVFSASASGGKIGLYNFESCRQLGVGKYNPKTEYPLENPRWLKCSSGVSWDHQGNLASFSLNDDDESEVCYLYKNS